MPTNLTHPRAVTRYALEGRVVTMDASYAVLERGVVDVEGNKIAAVVFTGAPPPPGFEGIAAVGTRGTIYPGLIDLHNQLSYDALSLWDVPAKYTNRDQWGRHPDYRRLISGPMTVLGKTPGYVEAVVRYVECKCLLGGVTTSQGIALFSNQGIAQYYRGVVRKVEETGEADLPDAATRISDVEAEDVETFFERLQRSSCLLLHLSEGKTSGHASTSRRCAHPARGGRSPQPWRASTALRSGPRTSACWAITAEP
jgi:cytosine/adenosine deaminase-related metal-dependent hydrolase